MKTVDYQRNSMDLDDEVAPSSPAGPASKSKGKRRLNNSDDDEDFATAVIESEKEEDSDPGPEEIDLRELDTAESRAKGTHASKRVQGFSKLRNPGNVVVKKQQQGCIRKQKTTNKPAPSKTPDSSVKKQPRVAAGQKSHSAQRRSVAKGQLTQPEVEPIINEANDEILQLYTHIGHQHKTDLPVTPEPSKNTHRSSHQMQVGNPPTSFGRTRTRSLSPVPCLTPRSSPPTLSRSPLNLAMDQEVMELFRTAQKPKVNHFIPITCTKDQANKSTTAMLASPPTSQDNVL